MNKREKMDRMGKNISRKDIMHERERNAYKCIHIYRTDGMARINRMRIYTQNG